MALEPRKLYGMWQHLHVSNLARRPNIAFALTGILLSGAIREASMRSYPRTVARLTDDEQLNALYDQIAVAGDSFIDANPIERETLMTRLDELFDQIAAIKRTRRT